MAKLCFGSLVLGVVIRGEIPQETLILIVLHINKKERQQQEEETEDNSEV